MLPNLSFPHEPIVWIGLVTAIIGAVAVFFPNFLTAEQQKAVVGLVVVAVPLILSFVGRSQVTPNAKLPAVPPAPPAAPA
jgi:hypothetical protein